MFEVAVESGFAAAHRLRDYEGACERLHGHNYRVRLAVRGKELGPSGMLVDFKVLKAELAAVLAELDHRCLNDDIEEFGSGRLNTTAENVACWITRRLGLRLPKGVVIASVTVWESEKSAATYLPP